MYGQEVLGSMSKVLISFLNLSTRRVRTVEVDPGEHTQQSPPGEDGSTDLWVRWTVDAEVAQEWEGKPR